MIEREASWPKVMGGHHREGVDYSEGLKMVTRYTEFRGTFPR